MSKVKLRSRSYKLSRTDLANICTLNKLRHKLRYCDSQSTATDYTSCKDKILHEHNFGDVTNTNNKLSSSNADKSLEGSVAETSSLESQSTSQMSSGISLESIKFCEWKQCRLDWITSDHPLYNQPKALIADELENHIMDYHVKPQLSTKRKFFECLWIGCKVYKKKSLSYTWLERHIIEHTENRNKPFSCIFKCSMRFSSQGLLEKHVQSHIAELSQMNLSDSIDLNSDINLSLRPKRGFSQNRRAFNYLTPYHVHRSDFIDINKFAQIQTNTLLQTVVIDSDILNEYGLDFLKDQPLPPEVIRLMTLEFKIMGKRKPLNKITQTLVEWILPCKLKLNTEWINDDLIRLAEYLSIRKGES